MAIEMSRTAIVRDLAMETLVRGQLHVKRLGYVLAFLCHVEGFGVVRIWLSGGSWRGCGGRIVWSCNQTRGRTLIRLPR